MTEHELINDTLYRTERGITAACTCGWKSGGHFTSLAASAMFRDHQDEEARASAIRAEGK